MSYVAAPIFPVRFCAVDLVACGVDPCEQPARTTTRARSQAALDIRAPLATIDGNTRAGDEAGLLGAHKRDHVRHLVDGSETAQRHLPANEVGDAVGVGLPAAVPSASLPQDRS